MPDCDKCRDKYKGKYFSREIWTITGDPDIDYANMRQGLREMDVLRPAKSKRYDTWQINKFRV